MKARSARRQRKQVFTRALMAKDPSRARDALQPAPNRAGAKRQVALSSTMTESLDRSPRSLREMPTGFAGGRPQPRASIPPEVLEPVRRQRRVDRSIMGLWARRPKCSDSDLRAVGLIKTSIDIYFADVRLLSVRRDSSSESCTPPFASSTILFMTRSKSPGFVAPIIFHTFLKAVLMFAAS